MNPAIIEILVQIGICVSQKLESLPNFEFKNELPGFILLDSFRGSSLFLAR